MSCPFGFRKPSNSTNIRTTFFVTVQHPAKVCHSITTESETDKDTEREDGQEE